MSKKVFIFIGLSLLVTIAAFFMQSETNAVTITYCSGSGNQDGNDDDYNPDETVDGECGSTPASLKKFLSDAGYNDSSVAGIMGNISIESCGYNLRVYNNSCSSFAPEDFVAYKDDRKTFSGGFGLAQWDSASRVKNLQEHADNTIKKSVTTLDAQASFIVKELKSSSYGMTPSKLNAMTMEEVIWIIMRDYETPKSVICTKESDSDCNNEASARNVSLTALLSDTTKYATAYKSYSDRLAEARNSQSISTASCGQDTGDDDGDSGDDGTGDDGTGDDGTPTVPPDNTSGALGKQTSNGYYAQGKYVMVVWRRNGSDINLSGCSLIAVANAAKYHGVTPNDPKVLAEWSKGVINNENDTGWNGSVRKLINHVGLKWDNSYLWTSHTTATSTKITKIRQVLASGGVVIAAGAREKNNPYASEYQGLKCDTNMTDRTSGKCVFSRNGHFIAIIGITADNKLIVANAANGRNGTATNDKINADAVLKASNKAIGVYK